MKRYKLKDLSISKLEYGSGAAACEYDGNTRYVRITDIDSDGKLGDDIVSPNNVDEKYILNDGDVLFARTGATVGKTYRYHKEDGRCLYAGFLIRVIPNQKIIRPDYLYYFTKSPQYNSFIQSSMKVVAQPNINAKQYGDLEFNVPELVVQDEIIEKLSKVVRVIDARKQELLKLDELIKARFVELFGNPVINDRGWNTAELNSVCDGIGDGLHGTPEYDENGGYPFINGNNLINGQIEITQATKMVNEETYKKHFIRLTDNAILLSINGTLGKLAFYNGEEVMLGKSACYCNLKDEINKEFVYGVMKTDTFAGFLESNATASTIKNVGLKAIRGFKLILPPEELQNQFVEFSRQVDKSKVAVQKALDEAQLLFDSLMQKYFG